MELTGLRGLREVRPREEVGERRGEEKKGARATPLRPKLLFVCTQTWLYPLLPGRTSRLRAGLLNCVCCSQYNHLGAFCSPTVFASAHLWCKTHNVQLSASQLCVDTMFIKCRSQRMQCCFFMYSFTHKYFVFVIYLAFSPLRAFRSARCTFPSGFVEICCSAFPFLCPPPSSRGTPTFPPCSLLSALSIPLYQLRSFASEVISFCIGGSEVQQYVRQRAAYLSKAVRLDSSKSHWNRITYSSLLKYLQNEGGGGKA